MASTIFVIDDDASVLRGLARLLRSAGYLVEVATSASQFLESPPVDLPGCILTDLRMPEMNGLELQEALAAHKVNLPVIFFSGDSDVPATVRALKGGALDFLTKPVEERALLSAVETALKRNAEERKVQALFATLTPRECEVCMAVARGMLNKQIAFELGAAEKTIKVHRARVMEKLGVDTVADLVRLVARMKSF
jgi:FixJ family two-component response regulator